MSEITSSKYGLSEGNPKLSSLSAITFGPDGILFAADSIAAAIYAIDLGDDAAPDSLPIEVSDLDSRIGALLGVDAHDVRISGLAVHPTSRAAYLAVTRGRGDSAVPVLIRVTADEITEVDLDGVAFAKALLDDAPEEIDERQDVVLDRGEQSTETFERNGIVLRLSRIPLRSSTITDIAWVDGTLLVAGASSEEFSSALRQISFPFDDQIRRTSLEIFHVSHGKYETASPIRTFIPFDANASVLASYTCTPVVHFPLRDLQPQAKVRGRTVAELGAMNQPLDILAYQADGEEYLLVSNTRHPLFKIAAASVSGQEPLTTPTEPVGVPREELEHAGVSLMANLGAEYVLMLQRGDADSLGLHSYETKAL